MAVLATLILLSYTTILQTVITVFAFTEIDAGNSMANNPPVWLADGTVLYAHGEHTWLLVWHHSNSCISHSLHSHFVASSMDTGKITLEGILLD